MNSSRKETRSVESLYSLPKESNLSLLLLTCQLKFRDFPKIFKILVTVFEKVQNVFDILVELGTLYFQIKLWSGSIYQLVLKVGKAACMCAAMVA